MNLLRIFARNKISNYVSPIQEFLQGFDEQNPKKSASQRQEIKKLSRIFYLRDHVVKEEKTNIWEGF